jgi:hypothetical protein
LVPTNALELLEAANAQARDAEHYCADLMASVFPRGLAMPTEEVQAAVKAKLTDLVISVETALMDNTAIADLGRSWDLLARSGMLRDAGLIEFALARIAEDRIILRIEANGPASSLTHLPTRLLGRGVGTEAKLSRQLLVADQRRRQPRTSLYFELDPDALQQLFWRVTAVLFHDDLAPDDARVIAAKLKIAAHDEGERIANIARKLLFALGQEFESDVRDPVRSGLHLFVAGLARDFGIEHDMALRLIDGPTIAPLAIMLAARAEPMAHAVEIIASLRGAGRDDHELPILLDQFPHIDPELALETVRHWSVGQKAAG